MKKVLVLLIFIVLSVTSYGQYRWEVSAGATFSQLEINNITNNFGSGVYLNVGYGYLMGVRAKTSIVFSLDLIERTSKIGGLGDKAKALQVGLNPKFRYLFNSGKDRFRPFINVGPSFRVNTNFEFRTLKLESDSYEKLIIGGVYGAGFSQMVDEKFDIFFEAGVMNDFTDNLKDNGSFVVDTDTSKFFDIYARVGVRFRIYDARR